MPVREQEYNGIPGLPIVMAIVAASGGLVWAMVAVRICSSTPVVHAALAVW